MDLRFVGISLLLFVIVPSCIAVIPTQSSTQQQQQASTTPTPTPSSTSQGEWYLHPSGYMARRHPPCHRAQSRKARQILHQLVWPSASALNYTYPQSCPWNPSQDRLYIHEINKKRELQYTFRCKICNKLFKNEIWIDQHMDRKHENITNYNATSCLADQCDVLGCWLIEPNLLTGLWEIESQDHVPTQCLDDDMERKQTLCQAVVTKCFPPQSSPQAHQLHSQFMKTICSTLQCSDDGRPEGPLTPIHASRRNETWLQLRWIVVLCLGSIILFGNIGMCIYRSDSMHRKDLSRLKTTRRDGWCGKRKKDPHKLY